MCFLELKDIEKKYLIYIQVRHIVCLVLYVQAGYLAITKSRFIKEIHHHNRQHEFCITATSV